MSVKKTVLGLGFAIAMFTNGAFGAPTQLYITVVDTVLYPGDPEGRYLTVRLNNPTVKVASFSVGLHIADPSIINFTYFDVDTTPPYDTIYWDCSPPPCHWDTAYQCPETCFVYKSQVVTNGSRISFWTSVEARRASEILLEVTGRAFSSGDPGPVLQPGNGVLFRVPLNVLPISDSVPLAQRQVPITVDRFFTYFSDSSGYITWRFSDSTLAITDGTVTVPYSIKGDCNFDGQHNPPDVVRLLIWVFQGTSPPLPAPSVGDVNCDGVEGPTDIVLMLRKVFAGDPLPCN